MDCILNIRPQDVDAPRASPFILAGVGAVMFEPLDATARGRDQRALNRMALDRLDAEGPGSRDLLLALGHRDAELRLEVADQVTDKRLEDTGGHWGDGYLPPELNP